MAPLIDSPNHEVSIVVDGRDVRGELSWQLTESMIEPAAQFTFRLPWHRDTWNQMQTDHVVKITIDGTRRLIGFIDDREVPEDSPDEIVVTGRNLVGRLFEAAPSVNYRDLGHLDLIAKVAAPWFTKVTPSNERNRNVIRGKGKRVKAKPAGTALELRGNRKLGTRIEPGQTRWAVIEQLCEQAGVLCWSSGDGRELVVGRPHYEQEIQFRFFKPAPGSKRTSESTVLAMGVKESTADVYSRVICVGSGQGTDANYGSSVASRYGEARDNDDHAEGIGNRFTAPKRLVIQRSVNSADEARALAEAELARRIATGDIVTVTAAGLGQRIAGAYTTLFGFDMLASIEHEQTGKTGIYMIAGYTMRGDRAGAEQTSMHLVPRGTELTIR